MKIQSSNCRNVSCKNLYKSNSLKQIEKNATKKFLNNVENVSTVIKEKNLHKLENVDIILDYTKEKGVYGTISSKELGTPIHPKNSCGIMIENSESVENFSNWAKTWEAAYSPSILDLLKKIIRS